MAQRCLGQTKIAEKVIEAENNRRKSQKSSYTTKPDEYMELKYSSLDSILAVTDAEECLQQCQKGKDILKKSLEQNLKEYYSNIQLCYKDQEKTTAGVRSVNYIGVVGCLEANIAILQEMDKRLNDEFLSRQDKLFF